jgi:hypothetical protein
MFKIKYMRVDFDKTYLFHDIDRHGTVKNTISGLLVDDFTMMISFLPDWDSIDKVLERRKSNPKYDVVYHQSCIIGKNGKHTGLFFTSHINQQGDTNHLIEYEWWQNPKWEQNRDSNEDEVQTLKIYIEKQDTPYEVIAEKYNDEYKIKIGEQELTGKANCVIDYSKSMMWLGAANRLLDGSDQFDEGFARIFEGEINKLHIQKAPMMGYSKRLFFDDFDKFKSFGYNVEDDGVFISTDFSQTTALKARDFSGNGLHPMVYRKEWIS